MKHATIVKMQTLALVATLACCTPNILAQKSKPTGGAKSQNAATADTAPKSPCGNLTFCYDTADFTATITQFRTSTDGSGNKILDAIVHFKNKTAQVLSLGYADASADAMDDHGNRYELNKNGVRGMGIITGTTPDAKFVLQANGTGDARFELLWNQKDQIAGASYELDMSIREMNQGDDKKWALGNETLVHYDGLANGSASVASAGSEGNSGGAMAASVEAKPPSSATPPAAGSGPAPATSAVASNLASGATAAGQPCAPAAANDAVSSTTAAISSISSLFGHKKTATTASTTPCTSTTKTAASAAPSIAPIASGTAKPAAPSTQPVATAVPAASPVATKPAPTRQTGVVNAALKQPVATTPTAKTPAPAATTTTKKPVPATVPTKIPAAKKPVPIPTTPPSTGQ